jgi:hypothetical protein
VAGVDDGGGMHACVGPTSSNRVDGGAISSDLVSYISLFKNILYYPVLFKPIANVA